MKRSIITLFCLLSIFVACAVDMKARQERNYIKEGNEAYRAKKYDHALSCYDNALKINPSGLVALFNKALATTRIAESLPKEQGEKKAKMLESAAKDFEAVAKHTSDNPALAAKAFYNRGNISMMGGGENKYEEAIDFYKNALRLNPGDNQSRRNLRIAQLNMPKSGKNNNQNQNKNKNKNRNQNKDKGQKQDNKDKNKDQDKDQNNNQNSNQNKSQPQQNPQQKQDMNKQTADRILKRSSDKENQTRKKFTIGNPNSGRRKGW